MELITLGNKLTDIVWMRYFIEYQGYDLNEYIVYQYNLSALLLKKMAEYRPLSKQSTSRQNTF